MKNILRRPVFLLLIFIAVALAVIQWFTPYYGDDLNYMRGQYWYGNPYNFTGTLYTHWHVLNGRISNLILAMMLIGLPRWVVCIVNAAVILAFFVLVLRLAGVKEHTGWSLAVVAVIVFLFPWYDDFLMLAISYNYIWATVASLAFLSLFLRRDMGMLAGLGAALFAGLAGLMHEGMSLSLLAGLCAYIFVADVRLDRYRALMLAAFSLATAFLCFSPAVVARLAGEAAPDAPWYQLMIYSSPLSILLLLLVVGAAIFSPVRLISMLRSRWILYVVTAFVATFVLLRSGTIGRPGWFSQTFALIAIVQWCREWRYSFSERVGRILAATVVVAIVGHYVGFAVAQYRHGREMEHLIADYQASPDGVVVREADIYADDPWYLLGKCTLVPRPQDSFMLHSLSRFYGDEGRQLVIVPRQVAEVDVSKVDGELRVGDAIIFSEMPADASEPFWRDQRPDRYLYRGDTIYVVTTFRSAFLALPLRP